MFDFSENAEENIREKNIEGNKNIVKFDILFLLTNSNVTTLSNHVNIIHFGSKKFSRL